jgi:hypothetical protein
MMAASQLRFLLQFIWKYSSCSSHVVVLEICGSFMFSKAQARVFFFEKENIRWLNNSGAKEWNSIVQTL